MLFDFKVGIIRQFTFSSSAARMSVITRTLGENHFDVFTKGAPEKLEELCLPHTLPEDFHSQLKHLTLKGTVEDLASFFKMNSLLGCIRRVNKNAIDLVCR